MTLKRLAEYLCLLNQLPESEYSQISSSQLADMIGVKPSQLRQDFHHFGGFGKPGHPYDISKLKEELMKIFGVNEQVSLLISGANCLTEFLLLNHSLLELNIAVSGVMDMDIKRKGEDFCGFSILIPEQLPCFLKENKPDIGVICSFEPDDDLKVLNQNGINTIWNLSSKCLSAPQGVRILQENFASRLLTLIYEMKH